MNIFFDQTDQYMILELEKKTILGQHPKGANFLLLLSAQTV